ncbi:MAG: type 1 periplasmic-binding domain-containing protein, partial [Thermoplasmatota archaeon]
MRRAAVLVMVLFLGPVLGGCITSVFGPNLPAKGVKTTCSSDTLSLPPLPVHNENPPPATSPATNVPGPTVKLGLLVASGADDVAAKNGAALAALDLTGAGADLTVTAQSITPTADGARAGANALADQGVAFILDALPDTLVEPTLNATAGRGVAQIATTSQAGWVTASASQRDMFFRIRAPASYEGRALAELVWAAGCRTAKLVVTNDRDVAATAREFLDTYTARGGTVRAQLVVPPGGPTDAAAFSTTLGSPDPTAQATNPAPDAVVLLDDATGAARVFRGAYDARLAAVTTFFLGSALLSPTFVTSVGDDAAGRPLAAGLRGVKVAPVTTTASDTFARAYETHFQTSPPSGAAEAYDAVYLGMLAAQCAKSGQPGDARLHLRVVEERDTGD